MTPLRLGVRETYTNIAQTLQGIGDIVARRVAERVAGSAYTKNAAIVENRAGAGGRIALDALKQSAPDGATLCLSPFSCTAIYLIPATAVLGAILLTGYLGGAICTHWRVGDPFFMQIGFGMLVWGGLFLRDGRLRDVDFSLTPARNEHGEVVLLIPEGRDISQQKQAREALERSREQLQRLASGLLLAREEERAKIARDVHDDLGQALTALKIELFTQEPMVQQPIGMTFTQDGKLLVIQMR